MHGSTSPSKKADPSYSHVQLSRTSAIFSCTTATSGSTPKSRRSVSVGRVDVHGWPCEKSPRKSAGKHAPPAQPSSPHSSRSGAPQPTVATRARWAATSAGDASTRSRSTCHRRAGSESSSQSVMFIAGPFIPSLCQAGLVAICGAHVVVISADPDADRAFFRDVLQYPNVDAGGGWLIFKLPPAELAVHPSESSSDNELYLMCDDLDETMHALRAKGVEF